MADDGNDGGPVNAQDPGRTSQNPLATHEEVGDDSGKRLIEVFAPRTVVVLATVAVTIAVMLCLLAIFMPAVVSGTTPRFFSALLLAFLFAVFVFSLYPVKLSIDLKSFSIPFVLVGPAALWIGLLLLFTQIFPRSETVRFFRFRGAPLAVETTWVLDWDVEPSEYNLVKKPSDAKTINDLEGILVTSSEGTRRFKLTIGDGISPYVIEKKYILLLDMDAKESIVTVR